MRALSPVNHKRLYQGSHLNTKFENDDNVKENIEDDDNGNFEVHQHDRVP